MMRETIAEATRLLRHLSDPGHAAIICSQTPDRVILSSTRNGISLGRGTVSTAAADLLSERGLVCETSPGAFSLTKAGRAAAGRLSDAPDDAGPAFHADPAPPAKALRPGAEAARRARAADSGAAARSDAGMTAASPGRVIGKALLRDGAETVKVEINEAESPLAWLHRRRDRNGEPFIDAVCFEAGERLRRDLTMARIMPRVTSRWSPAGGGSGGPASATDAMVSARQRLDRALDAVDGDYAGILLDVCGFLKRIEDVERERHWPPRSGKVVLKLALQRLAAHYGLAREARGPDNAARIRSWQAC